MGVILTTYILTGMALQVDPTDLLFVKNLKRPKFQRPFRTENLLLPQAAPVWRCRMKDSRGFVVFPVHWGETYRFYYSPWKVKNPVEASFWNERKQIIFHMVDLHSWVLPEKFVWGVEVVILGDFYFESWMGNEIKLKENKEIFSRGPVFLRTVCYLLG